MNKLQNKRIENALSQSKLAQISEVNLKSLQGYEGGYKDINHAKLKTILKLCAALNCSLDDILDDPELLKLLEIYESKQK